MQFIKLAGTKVTIYKNAEFPYKDKWEFMLEDTLCYNTAINKNWYIYCDCNSELGLGPALIQRFEHSYNDYQKELVGDLNTYYIFRKGKLSLTNTDIKKILKIIFGLNVDFQLEVKN